MLVHTLVSLIILFMIHVFVCAYLFYQNIKYLDTVYAPQGGGGRIPLAKMDLILSW